MKSLKKKILGKGDIVLVDIAPVETKNGIEFVFRNESRHMSPVSIYGVVTVGNHE